MKRRDFLLSASVLPTLAVLPTSAAAAPAAPAPLPFLIPPQAPLDHKGAVDIRVLVRSAQTGGIYSSVETAVAPRKMGPTPHAHRELDELMYVLSGTASVLMNDEVIEVAAGGWHLRPRQIRHTFWNARDEPLRFIDMYFNQAFEDYLELTFHQLTAEKGFPDGSEAKRAEILRLSEKYGIIRFPDGPAQRAEIVKRYNLT